MQFGHFARDYDMPVFTQTLNHIRECLHDPMRGFVEKWVRGEIFTASSAARLSPRFGGRNPLKRNESVGSPLATSAARKADAPGIGTTGIWCRIASEIRRKPGS